jgi:hypothetical protein
MMLRSDVVDLPNRAGAAPTADSCFGVFDYFTERPLRVGPGSYRRSSSKTRTPRNASPNR